MQLAASHKQQQKTILTVQVFFISSPFGFRGSASREFMSKRDFVKQHTQKLEKANNRKVVLSDFKLAKLFNFLLLTPPILLLKVFLQVIGYILAAFIQAFS